MCEGNKKDVIKDIFESAYDQDYKRREIILTCDSMSYIKKDGTRISAGIAIEDIDTFREIMNELDIEISISD